MNSFNNEALLFKCGESDLVGIVTVPDTPRRLGIVTIVAGGPQYRVGLGRQLVELSRFCAKHGYPTLRFDYQGMGDSEGETKDFTEIKSEIAAAVAELRRAVPEVTDVVLWGGCNAASAILMFASEIPGVSGMLVNNPYIESETAEEQARRIHYLNRLKDRLFWKKLFKGEYLSWSLIGELFSAFSKRFHSAKAVKSDVEASFTERMLRGFQNFSGKSLLITSGNSIDAQKFTLMTEASDAWSSLLKKEGVSQVSLGEADHGFSSEGAREQLFESLIEWLDSNYSDIVGE